MELNQYNGFEDHCKNTEMGLKRKFEHKESHNIDTMEHIMQQRKDQEFIDHSLLAPEYMRDPNHFIMDLMNFPKTESAPLNTADNLPTDLHFHNTLFPVTTEDHHHSNESRKTPPTSVFMPLNNDFLMPVQKSYNTAVNPVGSVEENDVKVVQQLLLTDTNVALDDASIDDDCDISRFNSRKILPHKKRISRKLRINHCDSDLQLNVPLDDHKLPHVEQLVGRSVQQFRCELCGHVTCSQLEFFGHLKQHYEPSTPDTILAAMKTSLEALGPEKSEEASDLCVINKKTDGLDQVFQDVHFPFDNFPQNETVDAVRVVMEPQHQHHVDTVDIKMVNATMDEAISATTSALQQHTQPQHQQPQHQQQQHQQQQLQQPQTTPNLIPEEFSDNEDMLEGIRDKVLIEDTCDTMDLMTPTSNGVRPHWFTNTCFNAIDLKTKPFCDVLFSGQFAPMLNTESTAPIMQQNSHITDNKLMVKEIHQPPPPQLQPPPPSLQSHVPSQPPQHQSVQHATDLRLHFSHPEQSLHHEPPSLNDQHSIQTQHIKIENTPPEHIPNIPNFQTSEDTLSGNEQDHHYDNPHQSEETNEDYNSHIQQQEREAEAKFYNRQHEVDKDDKEYDESVYGENPEEMCSENDEEETTENGKRKKYVCNKCERIFNSCNALKYHYRTHSGLRPHQCDICNKSFFAIGALKAHTRTHTGDKPFDCNYCDRKFRQWGDLKYHTISIHSTEKNHQCEFCGKSFSRKYSLVVHLRIHTSERNYKCEFCTKTFRASTYLQNHRKIHTGEKPYECDICFKKFRVSGDLRRHQRIHERKRLKQDLMENANTSIVKSTVCM